MACRVAGPHHQVWFCAFATLLVRILSLRGVGLAVPAAGVDPRRPGRDLGVRLGEVVGQRDALDLVAQHPDLADGLRGHRQLRALGLGAGGRCCGRWRERVRRPRRGRPCSRSACRRWAAPRAGRPGLAATGGSSRTRGSSAGRRRWRSGRTPARSPYDPAPRSSPAPAATTRSISACIAGVTSPRPALPTLRVDSDVVAISPRSSVSRSSGSSGTAPRVSASAAAAIVAGCRHSGRDVSSEAMRWAMRRGSTGMGKAFDPRKRGRPTVPSGHIRRKFPCVSAVAAWVQARDASRRLAGQGFGRCGAAVDEVSDAPAAASRLRRDEVPSRDRGGLVTGAGRLPRPAVIAG